MKQAINRKKKILHTTTRIVLGGGAEKNIFYTIAQLKDDFDFHLSCGIDYNDPSFNDFLDVKIIICPSLVSRVSFINDIRAVWFYYKLIKKEKYDIVHTHETKASFITKLAAWLAGCPYVIYGLHGVVFNEPMNSVRRYFYLALEKLTIHCADFIVAVGYNTIEAYHERNIGNDIPYEIVRSGINFTDYLKNGMLTEEEKTKLRTSLGIAPDTIVMINVGRFSYSKAQRYTIEAFATLHKKYPNSRLLLLGNGELAEECKALAKQLGLCDNEALFMGYQKDIPKYLAISDMFMFTSLREGLPRVIVEASLLQVPVVTFVVEGAAEVVEHGKTGFIVPQKDVKALVNAAEQLFLDPALRVEFGRLAKEHVMKEWDMHVMAVKLTEIYNRG
jgi:glycosyltransferase involved in cell wall biosynthesis